MKRRDAPPLYLITGILFGLLCGLALSYWIFPVRYTDTSPSMLSDTQKATYRSLVARTYLYEADPQRAFSRLNLLADPNMGSALVIQAQQMLAENLDPLAARGMALLAAYLTDPKAKITPIVVETISPTSTQALSTPTLQATATTEKPTNTPFATFTPRPTATARPTQAAPYALISQENVCKGTEQENLLQIYVYDQNGEGLEGVEIQISKQDGNFSSFFTGFYPEINPGYADYDMIPKETYQIRVGEGGDLIGDLTAPQCTSKSGKTYWGGLLLKFKQK